MYDNVESIDQLEILRILGERREKEWDCAALAEAVQAKPQAVKAHLIAMHARGLLVMTASESGLSCRFGLNTAELEIMVLRLLQMYKERPVTMIKMVYARAQDPLRAFADAFRIRKQD